MTPAAPASTVLHPAGRLLWRGAHSAQIEIGSRRLVLDGVDTETVRRLVGRATAAPGGVADDLRQDLLEAGVLWPAPDGPDDPRQRPPRPRLGSELAAVSTRAGRGATELLDARGQCTVTVQGEGRAGPHIAAVLAAAGVGRVAVLATAPTRLQHAVPGGLQPAHEGAPLNEAAAAVLGAHAPEADTVPPPFGTRPDLVVLAVDEPVDDECRDALHARGCAHLLVRLAADHAVVGPLVLPGLTSCLRCADLHRLDRDPAWTALAVQLSQPRRSGAASEVALATVLAGLAALQALDFLDGGQPAAIEGTLEVQRPDWRVRRRSWPVHAGCDCMPTVLPTRPV